MAGDENNMSVANTDGNYRGPGIIEERINHEKIVEFSYNKSMVLRMKY